LRRTALGVTAALLTLAALPGCTHSRPPPAAQPPRARTQELVVIATAYNSLPEQTKAGDPTLTASGLRLRTGMHVVAVSDDLFVHGLGFGTRVWIEGVAGTWQVADRMAPRWTRRIDVYMGRDRAAARRFGARRVHIRWQPPD